MQSTPIPSAMAARAAARWDRGRISRTSGLSRRRFRILSSRPSACDGTGTYRRPRTRRRAGAERLQTRRPWLMKATWKLNTSSGGTLASMTSWALSALVFESMARRRWHTRKMWVSMAMAGIPIEKFSTIPADLGPMPGSCRQPRLSRRPAAFRAGTTGRASRRSVPGLSPALP